MNEKELLKLTKRIWKDVKNDLNGRSGIDFGMFDEEIEEEIDESNIEIIFEYLKLYFK